MRDCSDPKLAKVIESQWYKLFLHDVRSEYVNLEKHEDMIILESEFQFPLYNGVFYANFPYEQAEKKVDTTIKYFKNKKLGFFWHTGPSTRPENLELYLKKNKLIQTYRPGMAIELDRLNENTIVPERFEIRKVSNSDLLKDFLNVLCIGNEISDYYDVMLNIKEGVGFSDNMVYYVGYLGDKPVASSSVLYADGVAGLYSVATIPEARRKGIGTAIALRPFVDARDRGYMVGILHASEMGYNIYKRMGFKEYTNISRWLGM